jgi:hypothetical protein
LLFAVLSPRNRDTITGDLIEEYREVVLPARGILRAQLWYVWQTFTLVAFVRRTDMQKNMGWLWGVGAVAWAAVIIGLLVRSGFTPPALPPAVALVPDALGLTAVTALGSPGDAKALWRIARFWAALLVVAAGARMAVDALFPFDIERYFLAQVRPGFSELDFPRRFVFGAAVALLLIAAGFHGAWTTSRVRFGIVAAITAALMVTTPLFAFAALADRATIPYQILMASTAIDSVTGALGAMLGRGLRGAPVRAFAGAVTSALTLILLGCSSPAAPFETAKTLAALRYDASKSVSVQGIISVVQFPPQGPGVILVKAKDHGYAFLTVETKRMAKAGYTRLSIGPGMQVSVTGLPAADGRTIDGVIAAQAITIKTSDGRILFDRSALTDY